jgi:hypothetical protein
MRLSVDWNTWMMNDVVVSIKGGLSQQVTDRRTRQKNSQQQLSATTQTMKQIALLLLVAAFGTAEIFKIFIHFKNNVSSFII